MQKAVETLSGTPFCWPAPIPMTPLKSLLERAGNTEWPDTTLALQHLVKAISEINEGNGNINCGSYVMGVQGRRSFGIGHWAFGAQCIDHDLERNEPLIKLSWMTRSQHVWIATQTSQNIAKLTVMAW